MKTKQQEQREARRANSNELKTAYRHGARYLRQREKQQPLPNGRLCWFSRDPKGEQIAHELAQRLGIDVQGMRADAKFANAVEAILGNCGASYRSVLFSGHLTRKQIESVNRVHPDRQQYEMEVVAKGGRLFQKPDGRPPPYDTLGFYEVTSRLARAEGIVRRALEGIRCCPRSKIEEPVCKRLRSSFADVGHEVERLRLLASRWPKLPVPHTVDGPHRKTRADRSTVVAGEVFGQLFSPGAAVGFIAKNVRDLPRLATEQTPTEKEVQAVHGFVETIASHVAEGLALLDEQAK